MGEEWGGGRGQRGGTTDQAAYLKAVAGAFQAGSGSVRGWARGRAAEPVVGCSGRRGRAARAVAQAPWAGSAELWPDREASLQGWNQEGQREGILWTDRGLLKVEGWVGKEEGTANAGSGW